MSRSDDKTIKLWDQDRKCNLRYKFDGPVSCIVPSKNGNLMTLGDNSGTLSSGSLWV